MRFLLACLLAICLPGGTLLAAGAPEPALPNGVANSPPAQISALSVLVMEQDSGEVLIARNADLTTPIASITKLMTAMVVLDRQPALDEKITISTADIDRLKGTGSRLAIGSQYTREQLLHLALIASENRAAHALGRAAFDGDTTRFVAAMNRKAEQLGMLHTHYVDPTGLSSDNRSSAMDLARLVNHAYLYYPEIREISTQGSYSLGKRKVVLKKRKRKAARIVYRDVAFTNTNRLTRDEAWEIGLSKTGFINEAGHCLVMQASIAGQPMVIVLLDSTGKSARMNDAEKIRIWLEHLYAPSLTQASRGA
jgi:D-alanyl-D-alanine endopeptidase (penicillin-binding protein 7)